MANEAIRQKAKERGVKLWEVAERIGLCDNRFSRVLRHELPEAKQRSILETIDEIAKEKGE